MAASQKTPNYNLPIYEENDVTSYLEDFNPAMETIDTAMYSISQNLTETAGDLSDLQSTVTTQGTEITQQGERISALEAGGSGGGGITALSSEVNVTGFDDGLVLYNNNGKLGAKTISGGGGISVIDANTPTSGFTSGQFLVDNGGLIGAVDGYTKSQLDTKFKDERDYTDAIGNDLAEVSQIVNDQVKGNEALNNKITNFTISENTKSSVPNNNLLMSNGNNIVGRPITDGFDINVGNSKVINGRPDNILTATTTGNLGQITKATLASDTAFSNIYAKNTDLIATNNIIQDEILPNVRDIPNLMSRIDGCETDINSLNNNVLGIKQTLTNYSSFITVSLKRGGSPVGSSGFMATNYNIGGTFFSPLLGHIYPQSGDAIQLGTNVNNFFSKVSGINCYDANGNNLGTGTKEGSGITIHITKNGSTTPRGIVIAWING